MQEPAANSNPLSKQERDVMQHVAEGEPNRHIADQMCLSSHTVKNHKANLKKKLGLSRCIQLYKYAIEWFRKASSTENEEEEKRAKERGWGSKYLIISML